MKDEDKGNHCDRCGYRTGCWVAVKIISLVREAERAGYLAVHSEPAVGGLLGARCSKHTHPLPGGSR